MSNTHGVHFTSRHGSTVRTRETHGSPDFQPSISGASFAEVRDGEQVQAPDIAPEAVDGAVHVMRGSLPRETFAMTIRPPVVVDALPALPADEYEVGDYVFLTTDSKLYRNPDDATWVEEDGSTLVNGTMIAGLIRAGAIAADQIAAGSIGTEHFQVTATIGNVENSSSSVVIDATGITITEGALTFQDQYGSTVLTGGGFSSSWSKFITDGMYNSDFAAGELRANTPWPSVDDTLAPYWRITAPSDTVIVERVVDSASLSGFALKFTNASTFVGGSSLAFIDQHEVPVKAGETYAIQVWHRWESAKQVWPVLKIFYFDASGAQIILQSFSLDLHSGTQSTYVERRVRTTAVPDRAVKARIDLEVQWDPDGDAGDAYFVSGFSCRPLFGDFDELVLHTPTTQLPMTNEPLTFPIIPSGSEPMLHIEGGGLYADELADGEPALIAHHSGHTYPSIALGYDSSGRAMLGLGDGSVVWDTVLYRNTANVLSLASPSRLDVRAVGNAVRRSTNLSVPNSTWMRVNGYDSTLIGASWCTWNPYGGGEIRVDATGIYLVQVNASFAPAAAGTRRLIGMLLGWLASPTGSPEAYHMQQAASHASSNLINAAWVVPLTANNTVALAVFQDSGAPLNVAGLQLSVIRLDV